MIANPIRVLFDWKVRGIRWVEIIGVVCVATLVFSVYIAKAAAARESARIGQLERQIADTGERVRLLRAEAARLEQPGRLEALSRAAGLAPVDAKRQADETGLATLKPVAATTIPAPAPAPATPLAPAPAAVPPSRLAMPVGPQPAMPLEAVR